jgi:MFS transporter, DHA1 family, inner membrane transport protein
VTTTSENASDHAPDRINWRIFLLALGMFALGTDAFVVAGVLPVIAHQMQVSEGLAGQLMTIFSLTYGLGAPVLAALTDRFSRNQVALIALAAFGLVNVGSALAPTFALLLLTRLLAGCCAATYAPLAYTIGTSLAPAEKRGQALALVVLGLTVATVLGSPLGTWVGTRLSWRFSFGLVALLACIAVLALLLGGLPGAEQAPAPSLKARLAPIRERHLLQALAPALLWSTGTYIIYTYIAPLLQHSLGLTDVSGLLLLFGIGVVTGNGLGGWIADRFGAARPLSIGLLLLALVYATLVFSSRTLVSAGIALFLWGVLGTLIFTPQQHRLLELAPQHASVVLALNNSTLYLGIAAGSAIGGLFLQVAPVSSLGWAGAAFVFLALLLLQFSLRLSSRHPQGQTEQVSLPEHVPDSKLGQTPTDFQANVRRISAKPRNHPPCKLNDGSGGGS